MNKVHTIKHEQEDINTHLAELNERHHSIYFRIYNAEDEAVLMIHSNQTGQFPKKSSRGNQYIMVLCNIDSNAILVAAMKNRTSGEMIRAYQELIDQLHSAGIRPKRHILNNECSKDFKQTINKNHMTFKLVLPHDHQRKRAEKAIQTFEAHFISILCGTDKEFPLHLWIRLLPQAEDTLNMLRIAKARPTVSAYTYLWGQHDYKCKSVCPIGMQSRSTRHTHRPRDVGTTYGNRVLYQQRKGTLQMPPSLHN
jgi:hypothetical protein